MKRKKRSKKIFKAKYIILPIAIILIISASFFGMVLYLRMTDPFYEVSKEVLTIGMFDEENYYISKASPDIKFPIKSKKKSSYELLDQDKKEVESKIITQNGKNYIVPSKLYEEGKTYSIKLLDTSFDDKTLEKASTIEFKIEEKEHASYQFDKDVVLIDNDKIEKLEDNQIRVSDQIEEDDILLIKEKDEIIDSYKVEEINDNIATTTRPEVADIYDDIDLYMESTISFKELTPNDNLKDDILKIAMSSPIYQYLVTDVYAEEDLEPSITLKTSNDKITIEIKFVLKADGKNKMGIDALKDHDLSISFSYDIAAQFATKVDQNNTINFDLATITSSKVSCKLESGNEYLKGIENISEKEYSKSIEEIIQKLEQLPTDTSSNSIDIGALSIPTPIPGLNVYMDIYFQCQLSVVVNASLTTTSENVQHMGFILGEEEARAYRNVSIDNSSIDFSITGKEEIHVGLGLDAGISIISKDFASASLGAEFGAYQTAFATFKINYESKNQDIHTGLIAKIEEGLYLKLKVKATLNVFFFKASLEQDLNELKYPVFTYGTSEVITSISSTHPVLVLNEKNQVALPSIQKKITDLDTGNSRVENCYENEITYEDENGNKLSKRNGYLTLDKNEDTKIYAVYKNKNQIFKTEIIILKQGSDVVEDNKEENEIISDGMLGSLSIDSNQTEIKAYKEYILNENYITDYQDYFQNNGIEHDKLYNVGYFIFDINQDGVKELVLKTDEEDSGWDFTAIYTYDKNQVTLVDIIYHYGSMRYDNKNLEIVYSITRPTMVTGGYSFYKLQGVSLQFSKSVGHDRGSFMDGEYEYEKYIYTDSSHQNHTITKEQEEAYFDNVVYFSYQDIMKIN